jgi:6-phosphogluconolactonase
MRLEVLPDPEAVACRAARVVAAAARDAVGARGRFLLATSGGATPWRMLRLLAEEDVPWAGVHLFQVDERVAPAGHPDRNLTHLTASLLDHAPLPAAQVHAMPVEEADLASAAARYAAELHAVGGTPAVLDLVHLGLGADGHTASLVPGDPALEVAGADVAVTGAYRGRRRMTLTYPALDRARLVLWVVTGAEKGEALARLRRGDRAIPAGRVRSDRAVVLADAAAAGGEG